MGEGVDWAPHRQGAELAHLLLTGAYTDDAFDLLSTIAELMPDPRVDVQQTMRVLSAALNSAVLMHVHTLNLSAEVGADVDGYLASRGATSAAAYDLLEQQQPERGGHDSEPEATE